MNKKNKSCLFIIFEIVKDKEVARKQLELLYNLHKKLILYTDDPIALLDYLEEIKTIHSYPFNYTFSLEKDKKLTEKLLRENLGKNLNAESLKRTYFSRKEKKPDYFPVFRIKVEGKNNDEQMVEKGYFYTDSRYYSDLKEIGSLYVK